LRGGSFGGEVVEGLPAVRMEWGWLLAGVIAATVGFAVRLMRVV
jgi:hypothetical protein